MLFRIPGTPASAAATLDSYQMAKQGQGGLALTLDLLCSSLGGLVGVMVLILVAPQIARFALRFSDFENFWLAVLGLAGLGQDQIIFFLLARRAYMLVFSSIGTLLAFAWIRESPARLFRAVLDASRRPAEAQPQNGKPSLTVK